MKIIAVFDQRKVIVYGQIAFYQSTGTSGDDILPADINALRSGTFFPFFGFTADGLLIKPVAIKLRGATSEREPASYEILREKVSTETDAPHLRCDDALYDLYKQGLLSNDMAMRFRFYDAMVISAQMGGGFWESDNGKKIIAELIIKCPYFKPIQIDDTVDSSTPDFKIIARNEFTRALKVNNFLRKHGAQLSGYASEEYFASFKNAYDDRAKMRHSIWIESRNITALRVFDRVAFRPARVWEIDPQTIPGILQASIAAVNSNSAGPSEKRVVGKKL